MLLTPDKCGADLFGAWPHQSPGLWNVLMVTALCSSQNRGNEKTVKHVMIKEQIKTNTINEVTGFRRLGKFVLAALSANKATIGALALLLGGGLTALASDNRAPEVPEGIAVPAGNKVHFHGFAVGVQIYTWDGVSWGRAVPEATLFHGNGVVTIHFAGPTWESNSGSKVVGTLAKPPVTVDPNAIPW